VPRSRRRWRRFWGSRFLKPRPLSAVIPAKTGTQLHRHDHGIKSWAPAFAGVTIKNAIPQLSIGGRDPPIQSLQSVGSFKFENCCLKLIFGTGCLNCNTSRESIFDTLQFRVSVPLGGKNMRNCQKEIAPCLTAFLAGCASANVMNLDANTVQVSAGAAPACGAAGAQQFAIKTAAYETLKRGYEARHMTGWQASRPYRPTRMEMALIRAMATLAIITAMPTRQSLVGNQLF
jgi:hypothetical protein